MTEELTLWQPRPMENGSDLLPLQLTAPSEIDVRGRENVEQRDIVMPSLRILSGLSKSVTEGRPGARVGLFYHSGAELYYQPPLRLLLCFHYRSRALFPNPQNHAHHGLEPCFSRNGLRGTVYGLCEECEHKEWPERVKGQDVQGPPCSESHNFVALTPNGPAVIRFWKKSYPAARNFLTEWNLSPWALWRFPVIIGANVQTKRIAGKDQPYYALDLRWQRGETVPPTAQEAAARVYEQVKVAHEAGRFSADDEGDHEA